MDSLCLFAQALGATPEFWLDLHSGHDLARRRPQRHVVRLPALR